MLLTLLATAQAFVPWGQKPVLPVLLAGDRLVEVAAAVPLSPDTLARLDGVRLDVQQQVNDLRADTTLPPHLFNDRAEALARAEVLAVVDVLGGDLPAFEAWAEAAWEADRAWLTALRSAPRPPGTALAYTVFGTQYAATTNDEVAIPDKCIKFANLGWSLSDCPSGYDETDYHVTLDRDAHHRLVWVGDVGPWNIDDNYWNLAGAAERPRRLFTDLPQGRPESEAAYYDDYNALEWADITLGYVLYVHMNGRQPDRELVGELTRRLGDLVDDDGAISNGSADDGPHQATAYGLLGLKSVQSELAQRVQAHGEAQVDREGIVLGDGYETFEISGELLRALTE